MSERALFEAWNDGARHVLHELAARLRAEAERMEDCGLEERGNCYRRAARIADARRGVLARRRKEMQR